MEYCDSCGKAYEIVYDVPDEIWDKITLKKGDGFLCIECANKRADELGIDLYWSANEGEYLTVEIKRLKKEKEWLLYHFAEMLCQALRIADDEAIEDKKRVITKDMQGALKGK